MNPALTELLDGSRWLMETTAFRAMFARAMAATPEAIQTAMAAVLAASDRPPTLTLAGDVAVIPLVGPITYKRSWFSYYCGGTAIEDLQAQFRLALSDAAVKTILFRCDSGGGMVEMVPEFADELFAARGIKPFAAVADTLIGSAAYWLAAQCDRIYASRSSRLGSIGVYTGHEDISGMLDKAGVKMTLIAHPAKKVDGNPYEPLSETARADLQANVDEVGVEFEAAVVRGRGVPKATVIEWTQLGIPPRGKRAIALGLADAPGAFDAVLGKLTKGRIGMRAEEFPGVAEMRAYIEQELSREEAALVESPVAAAVETVDEQERARRVWRN